MKSLDDIRPGSLVSCGSNGNPHLHEFWGIVYGDQNGSLRIFWFNRKFVIHTKPLDGMHNDLTRITVEVK